MDHSTWNFTSLQNGLALYNDVVKTTHTTTSEMHN